MINNSGAAGAKNSGAFGAENSGAAGAKNSGAFGAKNSGANGFRDDGARTIGCQSHRRQGDRWSWQPIMLERGPLGRQFQARVALNHNFRPFLK